MPLPASPQCWDYRCVVPWWFIQCQGWIAQGVYLLSYIPSLESVFYTERWPCSSAVPWPLTGSFAQRVPPAGSCLFFLLALWLSLLLPALYLLLARLPRNSEFLPLYYTLLCTWLGQPPRAKAREGGRKDFGGDLEKKKR